MYHTTQQFPASKPAQREGETGAHLLVHTCSRRPPSSGPQSGGTQRSGSRRRHSPDVGWPPHGAEWGGQRGGVTRHAVGRPQRHRAAWRSPTRRAACCVLLCGGVFRRSRSRVDGGLPRAGDQTEATSGHFSGDDGNVYDWPVAMFAQFCEFTEAIELDTYNRYTLN